MRRAGEIRLFFVFIKKCYIFAVPLGNDSLAQLVEHSTFNAGVLGSSPKRITEWGARRRPVFVFRSVGYEGTGIDFLCDILSGRELPRRVAPFSSVGISACCGSTLILCSPAQGRRGSSAVFPASRHFRIAGGGLFPRYRSVRNLRNGGRCQRLLLSLSRPVCASGG